MSTIYSIRILLVVLLGGSYVIAKRKDCNLTQPVKEVTSKFMRYAILYKQFGSEWTGLDFSEEALIEMFNNESAGTTLDKKKNGFYIGKQWMGVTISMWREDRLSGHLRLRELYEDGKYPHWWLDSVL